MKRGPGPEGGLSEAVVSARRPERARETSLESAKACTRCDAPTPVVDQFYADDGVVCPACHLEADVVRLPHAGMPVRLVGHGLVAVLVSFHSFLAYGTLRAWLIGGAMIRSGNLTVLFMAAMLGAMGLAFLVGGLQSSRDAALGRLADIESPLERVVNGLSGGWMTLNGAAIVGMMAWLTWLAVVG